MSLIEYFAHIKDIQDMAKGTWVPEINKLMGYDCVCTVQDSPYRHDCPVHDPTHPAFKLLQHHEKETRILLGWIQQLAIIVTKE